MTGLELCLQKKIDTFGEIFDQYPKPFIDWIYEHLFIVAEQ
jgi:hypothetical protein